MDEKEVKILFGQRIKRLRNGLNLTQFTLGELAGINQRQITLIEAGKSFPSLKTLVKFTEIFSCQIQDLFLFENQQKPEILKERLSKLIENSAPENLRTLYAIARELV